MEYWIIFPAEKAVEILILKDKKYEVLEFLSLENEEERTKVKSKLLNGLEIDLTDIFEL